MDDAGNLTKMEIDIDMYSDSGVLYEHQDSVTLTHELLVCVPAGVLNTSTFTLNSVGTYEANNWQKEFWYHQNFPVNNTNAPQEIPWYILLSEDSTSFIVKVQDGTLQELQDHIVEIQRFYPSIGEYLTVQTLKTDENGKSIGFYTVETVDYRHRILLNNTVLETTPRQKVFAEETPYTLTFTVGAEVEIPWQNLVSNGSVLSNLSFDSQTNVVTFAYYDTNDNISFGNLLVYELSNINETTFLLCNETSTLSAATLTCDMSNYNGTFSAYAYVDSTSDPVRHIIQFIVTTAQSIFGATGVIVAWFIILTAALAFLWNPSAGIIVTNIAIILVNIIGFVNFGAITISAIFAVSVLLLALLRT